MTPILLDGNNLIKRCCSVSALDDLKAGGVFTGGVYGALSSLSSFLMMPDVAAGPVYCFLDGGTPPERLELIPGYKANRAERKELMSEEDRQKWLQQFALCRELFALLGVVCIRYKGFEADDVVCAAARVCVANGQTPIVVSSDKDLRQSVAMGAVVCDLANERWVNAENFAEVSKTRPETYLLYRTLVGDSSDGIKGCRGCGEVTAPKVIAEVEEYIGEPIVAEDTPIQQLRYVHHYFSSKEKRKTYEENFLEEYDRLRGVIYGIDLSNSFKALPGLVDKLNQRPVIDKRKVLQFAIKLSLRSVVGSPQRYIQPFQDAASRRDAADVVFKV